MRGFGGCQRVQGFGPPSGDLGRAGFQGSSGRASASVCRAARSVTRSAASLARSAQPARSAVMTRRRLARAAWSRASESRSAAGGGLAGADGRQRGARLIHRRAQFGDVGQGGLGSSRTWARAATASSRSTVIRANWSSAAASRAVAVAAWLRRLARPARARSSFCSQSRRPLRAALFGGHRRLRGGFGRRSSGTCSAAASCSAAARRVRRPVSRLRCCSRTAAWVGVPARMV